MKVMVTGGVGAVGSAVVERLVKHGWDVRVVDRKPTAEVEPQGFEYQTADITNYDEIRAAMQGCETVVHLAAIANPMFVPPQEIFRINVQGTYNVYEAAAAEGIQRVVQASSINAFGCFWGNRDIFPEFFPLDETHPTATTDVYSFSKEVVEDIGDYYWRRVGISGVSMRFPGVWGQARFDSDQVREQRAHAHRALDEFAALSDAERATRLVQIRKDTVAFRGAGNMEYPKAPEGMRRGGYSDDPLWPVYAYDRFNFWAYVDARDAAQSIEKGLKADYTGHHALFINAKNNSLGYDTTKLAALLFPEVTTWTRPLHGDETLVSTAKAKALIGFEPEYAI